MGFLPNTFTIHAGLVIPWSALDSSVSAELMRLGFETTRQTVIKRGPVLITAHSASLTIRCISNAAAKPSRLDEGLKPPDNSHKSLMRTSLIALVGLS